jgi:transglutaminase-like putative cysteine protease
VLILLALLQAEPPILHEYVEIRTSERAARRAPELVGAEGSGTLPQEVREDGAEVHAPAKASHEPQRDDSFRPDRDTSLAATGSYDEPFSPSVAPFARLSALDEVREDYQLIVHDRALGQVPIAQRPTPDRILFYGRVEVTFRRGIPVALPSPAPDVRLYGYELKSGSAKVEFLKDGADNLYARADVNGKRQLTFLVDAPRSYFEGPVPQSAQLAEVQQAPVLPEPVQRAGNRVLDKLALSRKMSVAQVLDRMTAYFRSFEDVPIPAGAPSEGDIYLDLALGQRGVCRHRAFAFVVTAQRLGVPARLVENDVHAFAEVLLPHVGWRRVDLGGAPMDTHMSHEARQRPRVAADDPFPQPESYKRQSASSAVRATETGSRGSEENPISEGTAAAANAPTDPRAPTHVEIDTPLVQDLRRGEQLDVTGRVVADGTDARGLTVDVYLRAMRGNRSVWIATAVTDAQGHFRARGVVSHESQSGDHQVIVRTRGDQRRAPSR